MEFRVISFDEVTSTNDVAMHDAAAYRHGCILTAQRQTAGRGQRGNRWSSAAGENLTFSIVLEPVLLVEHQFRISEMASLAASDAIRSVTDGAVACCVKWPNDLYVGNRKIGGILIEHSLHSEWLSRSVIGIGINVRQRDFDPALPNPTSIANELPADAPLPAPEEVLAAFCTAFDARYAQDEKALHADFMARLWRGDPARAYSYRDAVSGEVFEASIAGIDRHTGELTLRIEDGSGEMRRYWFKEVEPVF
ncbi:biotin--[acetyl-CoA-carboxylase] ligase [uncultured Rikenella sp.]|uniref:biotin--[acetyl-CoA-carboxylase] ligase n=1 Tax=uncultured Rikenella sp. TaxID=368003 RepID=UPI00262594BB|nr:biotin--[acetyl-CoA-carboxylase] ligase [uncultured Rikenella sp.]